MTPTSLDEEPLKLIGVAKFREIVPVGRTKTYDLIKSGKLDTIKIGRRTLITMASVERLLESSGTQEVHS